MKRTIKKKVYFLIACGGYLKKPEISKVMFTVAEQEKHEGFSSTKAYIRYILNDYIDEYAQRFALAVALSEKDYLRLHKISSRL
jgi:hypothetical protein